MQLCTDTLQCMCAETHSDIHAHSRVHTQTHTHAHTLTYHYRRQDQKRGKITLKHDILSIFVSFTAIERNKEQYVHKSCYSVHIT